MNDIRGFMLDGDFNAIKSICSNFNEKDFVYVIEIGTLYGKSAVAFDDALHGIFHHITTMDVCQGWQGPPDEVIDSKGLGEEFKAQVHANRSTAQEQFEEVHRNIKGRPITFLTQMWSKWDEPPAVAPSIVFYDGSHTYQETKDVLNYWFKHMNPGGIIAIDDYNCGEWHDLKRAVDEFCSTHGYTITPYPDSKIISISL